VNFSNSFREFSVKFGTFLKLYREMAHFSRELGWPLLIMLRTTNANVAAGVSQ